MGNRRRRRAHVRRCRREAAAHKAAVKAAQHEREEDERQNGLQGDVIPPGEHVELYEPGAMVREGHEFNGSSRRRGVDPEEEIWALASIVFAAVSRHRTPFW